jgi:MFS family permease
VTEARASVDGNAVSWSTFLSTYLPALVLALGTGIALPALPALAKSFGISFGLASGVVTAFLLGNVAGTLPSGWLIDRFGRRPMLIGGPVLTAMIALVIATTQSFPELLVLRFLNGFATQMWLMARLAAIAQDARVGQRGRLVTWMFGMDNTGRLAGPVLGGFIAGAWGARAPFVMYAVLALLAIVPTLVFAERRSRDAQPAPVTERIAAPKLTLRELVMPRLAYFGVTFFAGLTRGPVQADLLHLYAAFAYRLGPVQIGYLATAGAIIALPIGFLAGWILDRFGRKRSMIPGFTGVAIAMAGLAVSAYAHLDLAWYVALFFAAVALQSLTGGSVQTIGADVAPPEARGTFLGLWRFVGQTGTMLGPLLFAILADQLNYGSSFVFTALAAAVVAFLLVCFIPETRTTAA